MSASSLRCGPRVRSAATQLAVVCAMALTGSGVALAQDVQGVVGFSVIVSHVSPQPGPVDPSATEILRRLRDEFHYESLRVLERRRMELRMQQIGALELPTGRRVQIRPLAVSPSGVLVAVDIPGMLQTDVRVPNRKVVVIGVDRYGDGKLILSLEPNY